MRRGKNPCQREGLSVGGGGTSERSVSGKRVDTSPAVVQSDLFHSSVDLVKSARREAGARREVTARSEATSERLLVIRVGGICKQRRDEQKVLLFKRGSMLFASSPRSSRRSSLRSSHPPLPQSFPHSVQQLPSRCQPKYHRT